MKQETTRRNLLKKAALGTAAVAAGAASAVGAKPAFSAPNVITDKKYEWTMSMTWPKVLPGLGTGAVRLAERITKLTEGRLTIKVYGAGELVPALSVFDAVADGSLQCAHGAPYYWTSKHRSFSMFSCVPGGLTQQEQNGWMYFGGGMELWHELAEPFGIIPFPAGNTGTQMGGWFNKKIDSVDDLKGLKMRIPGLGGEVFTKLGGNPQTIPGGELYTSLQQGVIDALEWVGPWNDMALGFHRIAKYYYGPGFHEPGTMLELIINKEAFEELPKDLQLIVKGACATENMLMAAEYQANNVRSLQELQKVETLEILTFPYDVLEAFFRVSNEVVAGTANDDAMGKKIYESWSAYRKTAMDLSDVTDYAFMRGRKAGMKA